MSIPTGQTRQRGEAIAAALEAHPPFVAWVEAGSLAAQFNGSINLKALGQADRIAKMMTEKMNKQSGGVLLTVTPFSGRNQSAGTNNHKVINDTDYSVNLWCRVLVTPESMGLPDMIDLLDEVQRVLATIEFEYPAAEGLSGTSRPCTEKVQVGGWEESPDPNFLNYQISISCRVPLGAKGS